MIDLDVLRRLVWQPDRMTLDELVFRLQHYKTDDWELGEECFVFYKVKELVDQYERFLSLHEKFTAERVLELGIWDGGSVAFWFEILQPRKHVAIDLTPRSDTPYFDRYLASRGAKERVATYWGTDQADQPALKHIAQAEFGDEPLDLVIDDASHMYQPTKASFDSLFARLRPGGLYLIEDWAWAHWPQFLAGQKDWIGLTPLTQLIFELVEAAGTSKGWIANLTIFEGFVAVERGPEVFDRREPFRIDRHISRPPAIAPSARASLPRRVLRRIKQGVQ